MSKGKYSLIFLYGARINQWNKIVKLDHSFQSLIKKKFTCV
jgi:hypothetical protein